MPKISLTRKLKKVKVVLLDVDGVLTDGKIVYDSEGRDLKFFDVQDGMGVHLLKKAGLSSVLVSARGSATLHSRSRDMDIDLVLENVSPKTSCLETVLPRFNVAAEELMFVGDDLVDVCLMRAVGVGVAVKNACPEVKRSAAYVTRRSGGSGAVREICEMLLKAQGKWGAVTKKYLGAAGRLK